MPREFEKQVAADGPFRLGDRSVEPSLNRISRGVETIQLELKVMDVLVCLAERAGEVLTRQEIIDRVWATEFISDNTLTHAVTELRNALGDDARNPSFIETIHRRGYRLIASIEPSVSDDAGESRVARFPVRERPETATDDRSPYPGLAAFTEEDAEFFFGREDEVARMWRKLTSRRLLAVIGPSGVGKSSFVRAGVMASKPEGWGILYCQPGEAPFAALARALVPEFGGDDEAISKLVHMTELGEAVAMVSRWRQQHDQALLIVDQFEELFTLNPAKAQASFSDLLRRIVDEADVHVLVSMRDDFLYRCHDHEPLAPIFDALTPLKAPAGDALHRALVEPASRFGFSFEDESLPAEMVAEVENERGALPLLAFALARLWEKRDREDNSLAWQAYSEIGGVGGALAQHAEATLKSIGPDRLPMVREIFRNLVTAQGTRAVRSVEDLLSVFDSQGVGAGFTPARDAAEETLHNLIGARLLTSFEEEGAEGNGHSRVEVVHESLLSSWPRLVRWQTQDADAGELRDQLRQAARTWHEHDRTVDFLWTGKAFREFSVWWENYPGGLSAVEEDFAAAMTAHAKRRKRLRRVAVSTLIAALLAGLAIVGSFWRESVHATRRAEATKLLALGQLELDDNPTAAAAHAVASLDLSESPEARRLALDALWRGPPATFVSGEASGLVQFTSDGRWLVQSFNSGDRALRLLAADGSSDVLTATERHGLANSLWFEDGSIFQTHIRNPEDQYTTIALWSAKERRELARARFERGQETGYSKAWSDDQMMVLMSEGGGRISLDTLGFDGEHRRLGTRDLVPGYRDETSGIRSNWGAGRLVASTNGHEIYVSELSETGLSEPRLVGRQPDPVSRLEVDALDRFVASGDKAGRIRMWDPSGILPPDVIQGPRDMIDLWVSHNGRFMQANSWPDRGDLEQWIWSLDGERPELLRRINLGEAAPMLIGLLDPVGRQVAHHGVKQKVHVWKLSAPADAEPIELLQGDYSGSKRPCFHPGGTWLVTPDANGLRFWPLTWPTPLVISQHDDGLSGLVFGPVGRWLASSSNDGTVKIWPLDGEAPPPGRLVFDAKGYVLRLARSPKGDRLLATAGFSGVHVISVGEEAPRRLPDSDERRGVAFSPDGRLAAAVASRQAAPDIGIWDVDSGQRIALLTHEGSTIFKWPHFVDQGTLLAVDQSGLRRWDIETGDSELAHEGSFVQYDATRDGRRAILVEAPPSTDLRRAIFIDLETGEKKPLESHGNGVCRVALDPSGTIAVTGDTEGTVRVGPVTGEEPHLFVGHEQRIGALAVDPSGRWIASGSGDNTIRLWPMPDLSKTPLHTLPREKLMAKLKTLTNLRVVRDADSSTGWKLELGPFPGWETVPEW